MIDSHSLSQRFCRINLPMPPIVVGFPDTRIAGLVVLRSPFYQIKHCFYTIGTFVVEMSSESPLQGTPGFEAYPIG